MGVADGLLGAGAAAATGNYLSAGLSLVGVGMSIFGANKQAEDQQQIAALSQQKIAQEGLVQDQKQKAMELSARRQQIEIVRNTQRARAQGEQAAVSGGAQFGSGYLGGQAQEQSRGTFNFQGVSQNLEIGENIFGIDKVISGINSQITGLQGQQAADGIYGTIGGALTKSSDSVGRLSGQMFSNNIFGSSSLSTSGLDGLSAVH